MREEPALLASIAAGDDTARLALADLLEERGDARSPWVRDARVFPWMLPGLRDPLPALLAAVEEEQREEALEVLPLLGAAAVPALLERVESGDGWAGFVLGSMKAEEVSPVLPRLIVLVGSADVGIAVPAAYALKAVGPAAAPALPALVRLLPADDRGDYDHWEEAAFLAEVFAAMKAAARPAVPGLARLLWVCHEEALATLVAIGPTGVPDLLDAVETLAEDRYILASSPLAAMAAESLPHLRFALRHHSSQVRGVAALALAPHDPEAAMPVLAEALAARPGMDDYDDLRYADAIGEASAFVRPPVELLQSILLELGYAGRNAVASCLERLGEAGGTLALLRERLSDADPDQRFRAVSTLANLRDIPDDALAAVAPLIDDPEHSVRRQAMAVLGKAAGDRRGLVAPSLAAGLRSRHGDAVVWAMEQLARQGDPASRSLVRGQMRHRKQEVRNRAVALLRGPNAGDIVPDLLRLAQGRTISSRAAAVWALGETGSLAQAGQAIRDALGDESAQVRIAALRAATLRGPALECADLVRDIAQSDPSAQVRIAACDAVPACGLPLAESIAVLRGRLEIPQGAVQAAAAHRLADLAEQHAEAVAEAVPDLLRLLRSAEGTAPAWALSRIGPAAVAGLADVCQNPPNEGTRREACQALHYMEEAAAPASEALLSVLGSPYDQAREDAAHALAVSAPPGTALAPLRRMLRGQQADATEFAITALVRLQASEAWPDIAALVGYEAGDVAAAVPWAARRLLPLEQARTLWKGWLASPREAVARAARYELGLLGEAEPLATPELFEAARVFGLRDEVARTLAERAAQDGATMDALLAGAGQGSHGEHGTSAMALALVPHLRPEATAAALLTAFDACSEAPFRRFVLATLASLPSPVLLSVLPEIRELCEEGDYLQRGPAFALLRRIAAEQRQAPAT